MKPIQTPPAAGQAAQWTTDEKEHDAPYQHIRILKGRTRVATIYIDDAPDNDFNAEQRANAAFIVTACNAYADNQATIAKQQAKIEVLVEALNGVTWLALKAKNADNEAEVSPWLSKAHSALAQSKETTP